MKRVSVILFFLTMLVLSACQPDVRSAETGSFAGTWTTNVGMVSFTQDNDQIIGAIQGYGNSRNDAFSGTINENGEAVFNTDWFGEFTLVLVGDVFKSKSNEISFCGIRGSDVLPDGCGFSGKWDVPSKNVFLEGTIIELKQTGSSVIGNFYDGNGKMYETFSGDVQWGKGWAAYGTYAERGEMILSINAAETGFEFLAPNGTNIQQLCALRAGLSRVFISSFWCEK